MGGHCFTARAVTQVSLILQRSCVILKYIRCFLLFLNVFFVNICNETFDKTMYCPFLNAVQRLTGASIILN